MFHTAPFVRDIVDHVVALVEADIHVRATADHSGGPSVGSSTPGGGTAAPSPNSRASRRRGPNASAFQSTLRKASFARHGGHDLVHTAQWLEADHKRVCEGLLCVYPTEHAWLTTLTRGEDGDDAATLLLWRKCGDRVFVFVLDGDDCLSLARHAIGVLVVLLSEAFSKSSEEMPSLKEIISRPDLVQACCSCVAPQHVLATVPLPLAKVMLQRLLANKKDRKL